MGNEDYIETEGEVLLALPNATFRVKIENGSEILCHISGKIRMNNITVVVGDRVKVAISPYNMKVGRITFRIK